MYDETDLHIGGVMTIGGLFVCFLSNSEVHRQDWRTIGDLRPSYYSKVRQPKIPRNLARLPVCHLNNMQ